MFIFLKNYKILRKRKQSYEMYETEETRMANKSIKLGKCKNEQQQKTI